MKVSSHAHEMVDIFLCQRAVVTSWVTVQAVYE